MQDHAENESRLCIRLAFELLAYVRQCEAAGTDWRDLAKLSEAVPLLGLPARARVS